jgi:hypothetical protein
MSDCRRPPSVGASPNASRDSTRPPDGSIAASVCDTLEGLGQSIESLFTFPCFLAYKRLNKITGNARPTLHPSIPAVLSPSHEGRPATAPGRGDRGDSRVIGAAVNRRADKLLRHFRGPPARMGFCPPSEVAKSGNRERAIFDANGRRLCHYVDRRNDGDGPAVASPLPAASGRRGREGWQNLQRGS